MVTIINLFISNLLILFSMDAGIIEDSKGEHNHPPNPQKLLAQLEEVTTIETVVNCMGTQLMKPQHLVTKVVVFLKSIFNHLFNLSIKVAFD